MTRPLVTLHDPQSPAAEAYRTLRTNLEFATWDVDLHTILFTAPSTEDTATVVANLAVTVAQTGRTVVAVEADLRHPRLPELFGVEAARGLSDAVQAEDPTADLPLVATQVSGLSLLPPGPRPISPADVLDSKAMRAIWGALREQADMVLVHAPSVLAVADPLILAPHMDGVLLVVQAGHTRRQHALQAKERLERVRARLLGVVLLDAPYDKTMLMY